MSNVYSIDQLMECVQTIAPAPKADKKVDHRQVSGETEYQPSFDASFVAITAGCSAVRALADSPVGQGYDEWRTLHQVVSRCKDGESIIHKISRMDPRYNHAETQEKFEEARQNMRPPTCGYITSNLTKSECKTCAVHGTIHSPMAFGGADEEIAKLQGERIVDAETQRFISLRSGQIKAEAAFRTLYNHLGEKGSITTQLICDKHTGKVDRAVYRPGCHDLLIESGSCRILNTWCPGGVEPAAGEWNTLEAHFLALIPNQDERIHFLNYLACSLQKPGVKLGHAILLIGKQGIGKSFIAALINEMMGADNIRKLGPDQADTRFRAGWGDCQVCFIEELMMGERLEFYNNLKPWLTEETCAAEEKHIVTREVTTPRGFVMFSNHSNATLLPPDDRRFFVVHSPMERQAPAYYDKLWRAVKIEASAFKHYLLGLDLSAFSPSAPAPHTSAKAQLIEDSRPPIEAELRDMIEAGSFPFHRDVATLQEIMGSITVRMRGPVRREALLKAMKSCGFERLGQIQIEDGSRPRLWVARNQTRWGSGNAEEIRAEMRKPMKMSID